QLIKFEDEESNLSRQIKMAESKLEKFCSDKAKSIRDFLRSGGDNQYNNYNKAKFKPKCKSLMKKDFKKLILSDGEFDKLKKKIESNPKEKLTKINYDSAELTQLITRTQSALSKMITAKIIDRFKENDQLNRWADQGFKLLEENKSNICPFCNQKISENFKISLEQHFNDEYEKFSSGIDLLIVEVKIVKGKTKISLPHQKELYSEFSDDYETIRKTLESKLSECCVVLEKALENLENKKNNPFKSLGSQSIDSDFDIEGVIESINNLIDNHNQKTTNFLNDIDKSRISLENHFVAECLDEYLEMENMIPPLSENLERLLKNIEEYREKIIKLESEVVGHRKPAEEINRDLHSYLGRKEIKFKVKENGYLITRNGLVAEALSEGEKTAISFIYFLKSLKDKNFDITHGIIVIDDPISSLDS